MSELAWPVEACRSCRAPIIWALTPTPRAMPIDAEPHPDGNVLLTQGPIRPHAQVLGPLEVAAQVLEHGDATQLFMPHHATCPDAEDWKR